MYYYQRSLLLLILVISKLPKLLLNSAYFVKASSHHRARLMALAPRFKAYKATMLRTEEGITSPFPTP